LVLEDVLLAAAAVVVTHNSEKVVDACLEALDRMSLPTVVVDNASTDQTLERLGTHPRVRVLRNSQNRGFAAACNQGIRASSAEFILLINPDVTLDTSVDALIEASERSGLASGKLLDVAGRTQSGFTIRRFPTPQVLIFELFGINRLWPSNPLNRRYRCLDIDLDRRAIVEQPAGAFLMTRRDVWERLDGFDEGFFPVWFEDVDYCRRAVDSGYEIQYVPSVTGTHVGGHSVRQIPAGSRATYWCASLLRYAAKHFRAAGYQVVCAAVVVSSVPRMLADILRERSLTPVRVYFHIMRDACAALFLGRQRWLVKELQS
jgi:GT2 family glycosyltransferase